MSDTMSIGTEALFALSKERLIEIILTQANSIAAANTAFERLTNDMTHHFTRMGAAIESCGAPIAEAKVGLDAAWRAASEDLAQIDAEKKRRDSLARK